jgi:hypothetical protein
MIACLPPDDPLAEALASIASTAAASLELEHHLCRITIVLDDFEPDRRIWLTVRAAHDPDGRRELTLYLHPSEVVRDEPGAGDLLGVRPVWESGAPPAAEPAYTPEDFHRAKAERFVLHQLLFARDLCDGSLDLHELPAQLAEAFQEAWSITIDGRLRRWHQPAVSQAVHRARFSRLFARYAVLLPDHWRIFHQLWDREDLDQETVLALVRRLPRGGRSSFGTQ